MPMGCCAQVWGRLSISFGRKWIMITGISLFELGSLIAGVSRSMNMFIGGRAIQGIGGSCIQSVVMIITTEITTIDKKPIVFSCLSLTFVVASVIGPIIGGSFGTYATWRWCFYLNLCCGAIIFPFFVFSYRPKPPTGTFKDKLKTVDFFDNFLLIASCILVLLALSFGQTGTTWRSASVISCFTLSGILFISFGIYNSYSKYPALPTNIITNPNIFTSFMVFTLNASTFMVLVQFLSVYFQNIIGYDSLHTGLSLIACAVSTSITAIINGILMTKFGHIKIFCLCSGFLLPISVGLMVLLGTHKNTGFSIGFQILLGVSCGLNFQGPMMGALIHAPKEPGSSILTTAWMNFGRNMGAAFFSELAGAIYTGSLKAGIKDIQNEIDEDEYPIGEIITRTDLIQQLNNHDKELVLGKVLRSVHNVFWLGLGISIAALVFTVFMSGKKMPKQSEETKESESEESQVEQV
ncbi:DEKNAAC101862 [Brettanomyces naardenensis]|uniref:DEKNAAC101862 n=1 Tax=Brettanomyces naardenensis TaxID=13370 RepID=A0A448YJ60_BRENA|nr:DEKNAAC101862 [Brettanomyces naardenensis]